MRHALLHDPRRVALRRALSRHRPRTPSANRVEQNQARASDILLGITGVVVLGALALWAALFFVERAMSM